MPKVLSNLNGQMIKAPLYQISGHSFVIPWHGGAKLFSFGLKMNKKKLNKIMHVRGRYEKQKEKK